MGNGDRSRSKLMRESGGANLAGDGVEKLKARRRWHTGAQTAAESRSRGGPRPRHQVARRHCGRSGLRRRRRRVGGEFFFFLNSGLVGIRYLGACMDLSRPRVAFPGPASAGLTGPKIYGNLTFLLLFLPQMVILSLFLSCAILPPLY